MTASRLACVALTAGIAAASLAGCAVSIGSLQQRASAYTVRGPVQTVVVTSSAGAVLVTGAASGAVSVTEHPSFRGTAPVTTHRLAAGTLRLTSTCPAAETCSVAYGITVPRSVTVRVTDGVGTIGLDSLSGQLWAKTNAGDITLDSLSGPVDAATYAGSVTGRLLSGSPVTVRVSAGSIDLTFAAAPAVLTAASEVGPVTVRVPGQVAYDVTATATVGTVTVGVSRSETAAHAIVASTRTGTVSVEPAP